MKVFVGCSAYDSIDPKYVAETKKVSEYLVNNNHEVIFGSYNRGLMGVIYNTYKEHNGKIYGVCAKGYEKYFNSVDCERVLVDSTLEQLNLFSKSDVLLYLPGGYGTYNEIFYMINCYATREINSKIILYNMYHYYDDVISMLNKIKEEKFATIFDFVYVVDNINDLKKEMENVC